MNQSRSTAITRPAGLKAVEEPRRLRRAERDAPGERAEPDARGAHVADVLLHAPPPGCPSASSVRWATRAGALRLKRGGSMSSSVPPPIVTTGE